MTERGQCVLVLHSVVDLPRAGHDVRWGSFTGLLDLIERLGTEVCAELRPLDSAALTFDDGTSDHLRVAEELTRRGLEATFFVPAGTLGRPGRLDAVGLSRIASLGHRIGAHSVSHQPLAGLGEAALEREVAGSKEQLERTLGRPVTVFAPPGGIDHPLLEQALRAHGFAACRSTRWGFFDSTQSRWSIPSIPVTELTLGRGWVAEALAERSMPALMRAAWTFKQAAPPRLARAARAMAHRWT